MKNLKLYKKMMKIAIPIALENLIYSLINFVDIFMVGKPNEALNLGVYAVSALGVIGQVFFYYASCIFGIVSGTSILASQYFGAKDKFNLKKILATNIIISLILSLPFFMILKFKPNIFINLFTKDVIVSKLAVDYSILIKYTFPLYGIGFSVASIFRAMNIAYLSLYSSTFCLIVNVVLNYLLIPIYGVKGAAFATLIARGVGISFLSIIAIRKGVWPKIENVISINLKFLKTVFKLSSITFVHEMLWASAFSTRLIIYGMLGTVAFASTNVMNSISNLIYTILIGIGISSSVIIGNEIGKRNYDKAYEYSKVCMKIFAFFATLIFIFLNLFGPYILKLMDMDKAVFELTKKLIFSQSIIIVFSGYTLLLLVGILRAGGDIFYPFLIETSAIWLICLPLTYILTTKTNLPISLIYLISFVDELIKIPPLLVRYFKKKWIKRLI